MERGGTGLLPHLPVLLNASLHPASALLRLHINSFCNFSTLKPFPRIFNLFLPVIALSLLLFISLFQQLSVLKKIVILLPSGFSAVSFKEIS